MDDIDYHKIKVEVGQIWQYFNGLTFEGGRRTITKVKDSSRTAYTKEGVFGYLDEDCRPVWNCTSTYSINGWKIIGWTDGRQWPPITNQAGSTLSPPVVAKQTKTSMDFFSGVPEGYCKCNILKSQCDYHR